MEFRNTEGGSGSWRRSLTRNDSINAEELKVSEERGSQTPLPRFSDTYLRDLACEHARSFKNVLTNIDDRGSFSKLSCASAFIGCLDAFVLDAVEHAMKSVFNEADVHLDPAFYVESAKRLQRKDEIRDIWRAVEFGTKRCDGKCVFREGRHWQGDMAECLTHHKKCNVPVVDIFITRFHCNAPNDRMAQVLSYVNKHRPAIVIFESADPVTHAHDYQSMEAVTVEFTSRGYEVQHGTFDAIMFGCAQTKATHIGIAIWVLGNTTMSFARRGVEDCFRALRALLKVCVRKPKSATELLYADNDEAVASGFRSRKQNSRPTNTYGDLRNVMSFCSERNIVWGAASSRARRPRISGTRLGIVL